MSKRRAIQATAWRWQNAWSRFLVGLARKRSQRVESHVAEFRVIEESLHSRALCFRSNEGQLLADEPLARFGDALVAEELREGLGQYVAILLRRRHGSGESLQMEFSGTEGFVVVQPFEEVAYAPSR